MMLPMTLACYRCQNCGRDVSHVQKTRRFWLCDDCWSAVVPGHIADAQPGSPEQAAIRRYWEWYRRMEERFPQPRNWRPAPRKFVPPAIDAFWPFCQECGEETKEYKFSAMRSLLGGHRPALCPNCAARKAVETVFGWSETGPDRDDETWLDLLWQSHREAFDIGVLPDYWYQLRRQKAQQGG